MEEAMEAYRVPSTRRLLPLQEMNMTMVDSGSLKNTPSRDNNRDRPPETGPTMTPEFEKAETHGQRCHRPRQYHLGRPCPA